MRRTNIPTSVKKLQRKGRVVLFDNRSGSRPTLPKDLLVFRTNKNSRKAHQVRTIGSGDPGVTERVPHKPGRSKYQPHVGKKQLAKAAVSKV